MCFVDFPYMLEYKLVVVFDFIDGASKGTWAARDWLFRPAFAASVWLGLKISFVPRQPEANFRLRYEKEDVKWCLYYFMLFGYVLLTW